MPARRRRRPSSPPRTRRRRRRRRRRRMHDGPAAGLTDWQPERPRFGVRGLLLSWILVALALLAGAAIVPGVEIPSFRGALLVAAVVAALTAVLPPLVA